VELKTQVGAVSQPHFGGQTSSVKAKGKRQKSKGKNEIIENSPASGFSYFCLLPLAFCLPRGLGFATQDRSWCAFIGDF